MQLELDIEAAPLFKVACRVAGQSQVYEVGAMAWEDAAAFVKEGVVNAQPVLVQVQPL